MEGNFDKVAQERAVLVGLNADCFSPAQTATDQTLEELEALLEEKMERWMYLEDLAVRIEAGEEV